jgi:hypothetical protein
VPYFRWPLSFEAAAAFWSPFFSAFDALGFGLQLPFSPCFLPGVGSKPGQQAFALDDFFAPAFFADFLPGVLCVSAPVMCFRFAAVFVFADFVARFTADFFAGDFPAAVFFAADFFTADFFAVAMGA